MTRSRCGAREPLREVSSGPLGASDRGKERKWEVSPAPLWRWENSRRMRTTTSTRLRQAAPLREEVLTAQKQPVEIGEVFIRKEVVTEERTITVAVQREEIVIERRPQIAHDTPAGEPIGALVELAAGETIRIPIREEQMVIEKHPIVTGELIVGKRKVQETRH